MPTFHVEPRGKPFGPPLGNRAPHGWSVFAYEYELVGAHMSTAGYWAVAGGGSGTLVLKHYGTRLVATQWDLHAYTQTHVAAQLPTAPERLLQAAVCTTYKHTNECQRFMLNYT
jgi:hypothetical protein